MRGIHGRRRGGRGGARWTADEKLLGGVSPPEKGSPFLSVAVAWNGEANVQHSYVMLDEAETRVSESERGMCR